MVGKAPRRLRFDEFEIDLDRRTLSCGEQQIPLFSKSLDLLVVLIERRGQVISKEELLNAVWPEQFVEEGNLTVQISSIRKALGENPKLPKYIVTVPGKGYTFIGQLDRMGTELIVERERITEIVSETEFEISDTELLTSTMPEPYIRTGNRQRSFVLKVLAPTVIAAITIAFAGFTAFQFVRAGNDKVPFRAAKVTQVTTSGDVTMATISPDGRFVAYVRSTKKGNGMWLQQIGNASAVELVAASAAQFWGITISPDGKYVYYNLYYAHKAELELHRVPILGGKTEVVAGNITGAISFSPNGNEIAYIQPDSQNNSNYLIVAAVDGNNKRVIAGKPHPSTFIFEGRSTAWSPDGKTIACLVNNFNENGNYVTVISVDRADGTESRIGADRWIEITSVEWLNDGHSIVISGKRNINEPRQLWNLTIHDSAATKITNDLTDYSALRTSLDNRSAVTVQTNNEHGIYVGSTGASEGEFVKIVSETSDIAPIEWISGDRILYRSGRDGEHNLWTVRPDGGDPRQLTVGAVVDARGFCETPDSRYIIFTSLRSGRSSLWRADLNGANQIQLTDGDADSYPQCSQDSRSVIFQRGIYSKPEIWSVPVAGGQAERAFEGRGKWPVLKYKNDEMSTIAMSGDKWYINSRSIGTHSLSDSILLPQNFDGSRMRWAKDGRRAFYIGAEGHTGNIWSLFLTGNRPEKLSNFSSLRMSDFAFSPDGSRTAVVRSSLKSDLVLFEVD